MTMVLGRTVTGDITRGGKERKEQKPGDDFLPLLDAVLGADGIESVRWTQYTPYFNDGDPCIFGISDVSVKMSDEVDEDEDNGYVESYSMMDYRTKVAKPQYAGVYEALQALEDQKECFEDFLQASFGDHAQVTATRAGFDVQFYEHD